MSRLRTAFLVTSAGYVCLLLYGCATASPRTWKNAPSADVAISAGMSEPDALQARQLYIWKCAKCHALYDPAQYEDTEWDLWMKKMSEKARLSSAESNLLNRYLAAFRGGGLVDRTQTSDTRHGGGHEASPPNAQSPAPIARTSELF